MQNAKRNETRANQKIDRYAQMAPYPKIAVIGIHPCIVPLPAR